MLPQIYTCALAAISLCASFGIVSAGHARFHHTSDTRIGAQKLARRKVSSRDVDVEKRAVSVSMSDLQLLQLETVAFQGWIDEWLNASGALDVATASSQLKQEFTAYQGWIKAWLDAAMGPQSAPPLPSSSVAVRESSASSTSTSSSSSSSTSDPSSTPSLSPNATAERIIKPPSNPVSEQGAQFFQAPSPSTTAVALSTAATPPSTQASSSADLSGGSAASDTERFTAPEMPSNSGGSSFDASSSSNVAVYYGQSPATSQYSLEQMCQSDSVDIVILAFLTDYFGPGGMPKVNFGSACSDQPSAEMQAKGATGLSKCQTMQEHIQSCQSAGKKVLLSLGGAVATSAFDSDDQATQFAGTLVDLFAGGSGLDQGLRPFGSVKLDGFDIDNEDHSTAHYDAFFSALRKNLDGDSSKKYFISAAPQCPRPDASIPLSAMKQIDFIFVQFYNNPSCNVGSSGFIDSLKAWSSDLGSGPRLFVGAPGCSECAGSGYQDAQAMASILGSVKSAGISNLGGVSLWDGPMSMANGDFVGAMKKAVI